MNRKSAGKEKRKRGKRGMGKDRGKGRKGQRRRGDLGAPRGLSACHSRICGGEMGRNHPKTVPVGMKQGWG